MFRKIAASAVAIAMFAGAANAEDQMTILYPSALCTQIVGSDVSAPSSDSSYYLFELHCVDSSGNHRVLVTQWNSLASFFGAGRLAIADVINLVGSDQVTALTVQ